MDKQTIKNTIEQRELNEWNCNGKLCDYFIEVSNIREEKDHFKACVRVKQQDEERGDLVFENCKYPKAMFKNE